MDVCCEKSTPVHPIHHLQKQFCERDLDNNLTAICIEPNDGHRLSTLRLAA